METLIISALTSFIVSTTIMHYHIHKVNELYKKYMDFEKSSVEEFAKSITSKLPKNSFQEEEKAEVIEKTCLEIKEDPFGLNALKKKSID